jgi:hypothetical protein
MLLRKTGVVLSIFISLGFLVSVTRQHIVHLLLQRYVVAFEIGYNHQVALLETRQRLIVGAVGRGGRLVIVTMFAAGRQCETDKACIGRGNGMILSGNLL